MTCNGFALSSEQHPGPGWPVRTDERYSHHPISGEQFSQLNSAYVQAKLKKRYVDPQLAGGAKLMRSSRSATEEKGPFCAPSHWAVRTVSTGEDLYCQFQTCQSLHQCVSLLSSMTRFASAKILRDQGTIHWWSLTTPRSIMEWTTMFNCAGGKLLMVISPCFGLMT